MSSDDHFEPIPGLPEVPPAGERILWQGRPDWRVLAWRGFGLRWFGLYFAALAALAAAATWQAGAAAALAQATIPLALGSVLAALVAFYARLCSRHTIYTITDRRLVIRSGVAIDMAVNLPFPLIENAALKPNADGSGDILLTIAPPHRVAWLALWPHANLWRLRQPEPLLRAVPDAVTVSRLLANALQATGGAAQAPRVGAANDRVATPAGVTA